jgi:K+-transporting ATPase c subunit
VPLKVGNIITGFSVIGQIESGGNTATLTCELRKHTAAAADVADASVSGLDANISVTADAILSATNASKIGLAETVAADETFYFLITATTAGSTDIALQGVTLTISEI